MRVVHFDFKQLPAAKCSGELFLPAVSLAFTFCGVTSTLTWKGGVEEKLKVFTDLFSEISYPRDIPVLAGLKKIPQRVIVRYGNRLHPQAPSSSHSSWLPPSLFV